jgi:hypothetical protein
VFGETPPTITLPTATPSSAGGAGSKTSVPSPGSGPTEPRSLVLSSTVDGNGNAARPLQASAQLRKLLPVGKTSLHFFAFATPHAPPPLFGRGRTRSDRRSYWRERVCFLAARFGPSVAFKLRSTGFQHFA